MAAGAIRREIIGDATLYLGDALDILPDIGRVDHAMFDPPYEDHMHNAKTPHVRGKKVHSGSRARIRNDGHASPPPLDFASITDLREPLTQLVAGMCDKWFLAFCTPEGVAAWRDAIEAAGAKYKRACFWDKIDGAPQFNGQGPAMPGENFVAAWCGPGHSHWSGGGKRGIYRAAVNTNRYGDGLGGEGHPTEKPLTLMAALIEDFTAPGELILDPCMGSGTTGAACLRARRRFIGIEKKPEYFEIAVRRLRGTFAQPDFLREPEVLAKTVQPALIERKKA